MTHTFNQPPIGRVMHYYPKLHVALIKFMKKIPMYSHIEIVGRKTELDEVITSMEYNHVPIWYTEADREIGVLVHDRVRAGDLVYEL